MIHYLPTRPHNDVPLGLPSSEPPADKGLVRNFRIISDGLSSGRTTKPGSTGLVGIGGMDGRWRWRVVCLEAPFAHNDWKYAAGSPLQELRDIAVGVKCLVAGKLVER